MCPRASQTVWLCRIAIAASASTLLAVQLEASPVNPSFETGLSGWTVIGNVQISSSVSGGSSVLPYDGVQMAVFNFGVAFDGALTGNVLSQDFTATSTALSFFWNKYQTDYIGDGGVTLQLQYTDLTSGSPTQVVDLDSAPSGSTAGAQPWREVTVGSLTTGNSYRFEFLAGFSAGVSNDNGALAYMLDAVGGTDFEPPPPPPPSGGAVPEPSTLALVVIGSAAALRRSRRATSRQS
jgi:hypothetical protein